MDFKPDFFHMIMALLLVFLALLAYRLLRIFLNRSAAKLPKPRSERELLMEVLHERTMGEKIAVADQQASEAALLAMQKFHSHLVQHLPLGLAVVENDGRIAYLNPFALQMLGQPDEIRTLQSWHPTIADWVENHRDLPEPQEEQLQIREGKQQLTLRILLTQLPGDRFMLTLQDRSKIAQLEEQIQLKRDLAFMGEIASGITHEVKNALAVIQGHVQMLPYGDVPEHSGQIQAEINRLLDSVKQFMRSSKNASVHLVAIPLRDVFSKLKEHWGNHQDAAALILKDVPPDAVIYGDLGQILVVLNNLILNGLQACKSLNSDTPIVVVSCEEVDAYWVLLIQDYGPGFSADVLQKLFVPFVSTKEGGSGFGLFHCRRIMLQHQGRLEVLPGTPTKVAAYFPKEAPNQGN